MMSDLMLSKLAFSNFCDYLLGVLFATICVSAGADNLVHLITYEVGHNKFGSFSSHMFPDCCADGRIYSFTVTYKDDKFPTGYVKLLFLDLDLPPSSIVRMYDGPSTNKSMFTEQPRPSYNSDVWVRPVYLSSGASLTLVYQPGRSKIPGYYTGFNAEFWSSSKGEALPGTGPISRHTAPQVPQSSGNFLELQSDTVELMQMAVADSTRTVYKSAFEAYKKFLTMNNMPHVHSTMLVTEDSLMAYVTYCCNFLKLSHASIKLYLCGIRFYCLLLGISSPFSNQVCDRGATMHRLRLVLKGVKRCNRNKPSTHLPITKQVLDAICTRLHQGLFSPFLDLMMETVCVVAFYAFLRCAEFTCRSSFDPAVNLCIGDLSFQDSHVVLTLKQSKADPFRQGVEIQLYCIGEATCPMCMLSRYLVKRKRLGRFNHDHQACCFINEQGLPLTRAKFIGYLRATLAAAGFDESRFSGHSFRKGAATAAASASIQDHLIKVLGRWASDSYCRYIHTAPSTLRAAQISMSHANV